MKYNLTINFVLPLLQLDNKKLRQNIKGHKLYIPRMIGSWIKTDFSNDFDDDKLLVIINNIQTPDYLQLYDSLISNPHCEGEFDYYNTAYSLLVYNMSSFDDYYKFKNGKYSEYSDWAKNLCLNAGYDEITVQHIFNKEEKRKEFLEKELQLEKGTLNDKELASKWDSDLSNTNILNNEIINNLKRNEKLQSKKTITV